MRKQKPLPFEVFRVFPTFGNDMYKMWCQHKRGSLPLQTKLWLEISQEMTKVNMKYLKMERIIEPPHDKTNKMTVCPAKTQISLGICPVWSESSLCTQWVAKDPSFLYADSKDSDQTGRMPRLIWVFAGRKCHFVGFVMRRLNLQC